MSAQKVRSVFEKIRSLNPDAVLVAATKYAKADEINEIIRAGVEAIGENRVQDALVKFPEVLRCERHFLGRIQSNKISKIVSLFDVVQSLDNLDHAKKLDNCAEKQDKILRVLVQVNAGKEEQKGGLLPETGKIDAFLSAMSFFPHLQVIGLMAVVPVAKDRRYYFRKCRKLYDSFKEKFGLKVLSMGSSDDFETALEEGSTMVRVGRLLF